MAQEVRKLSTETANATENIEQALKNINVNIESLRDSLTLVNEVTSEQAKLVQDFSDIIEQLNSISNEMHHFLSNTLK